jgi:putative tricarboxylic transport membrane protein
MQKADAALAALTVVFGLWVAISGLNFGYTRGGGPGPGFFPFWVGLGIAVLGAVNVWRSLSGREIFYEFVDAAILVKVGGLAGAIALFLLAANHIGMLIGSGFLVLAIGFVIRPTLDRSFVLRLALIAIAVPIAAYVIFVVNLGVRIIPGPLGF